MWAAGAISRQTSGCREAVRASPDIVPAERSRRIWSDQAVTSDMVGPRTSGPQRGPVKPARGPRQRRAASSKSAQGCFRPSA